ncbi:hypothetical protein, partial [Nonomuraea maheshkhaliensis]|uniref:hypothetical protein n=1 Tax=Nonomuraea maheshkhaliensis TaxID=419590 RepID=UPI0031F81B8A
IERAADDVLLSFGWVTGDEAYGDNTVPRERCRSRGLNQVFARADPAHRQRDPAGSMLASIGLDISSSTHLHWSHWRRHQARARRAHYQCQRRLVDH